MIRRLAWLPLLCLPLFTACSEKDPVDLPADTTHSVPEEYDTIQEAASVAQAGDKIVVSYQAESYIGDVVLPTGVTLMGHTGNPLFPTIEGQVSVTGGDASVKIQELAITNDSGPGVVLQDSDVTLSSLWILNCAGAGVSLRGDSHAYVSGCDIENCSIGVQIMNVTQTGDSTVDTATAARIGTVNFIDNGPLGDFDNVVFQNVPVLYTVRAHNNYWGQDVTDPQETITDGDDIPTIFGFADTAGGLWFATPRSRWWRP